MEAKPPKVEKTKEIELVSDNLVISALPEVMEDLAGQLSPRSEKIYRHDARHFAAWLATRGLILETVNRSSMIEYRRYLSDSYAKATAARMYTVSRRLLDEAVKRGTLAGNPASDIKGIKAGEDETPHQALTKEQAREMLAAIDLTTGMGQRDYALLKLFVQTGLRLSELAALTVSDMTTSQGHHIVTVKHGKGDKRRIAKLRVDVVRAIENYLTSLGEPRSDPAAPLFVAYYKGDKPALTRGLTPRQIERIVAARARVIGLKLSPHALRASFITIALENGAKLTQVQYAAGHKDPRTTERYQKRKLNLDDNAVDFVAL